MLLKSSRLTKVQKKATVSRLFEESAPSYDFFLMLILSSIIVALGLLIDNVVVIIGGMLVAPILFPILSFAMGVVVGDHKLMKRSTVVIFQSIFVVIIISLIIAFLALKKELTVEITSRVYPSLAYFLIALFSGGAAAYALARPSLSEILPGVAISVSLIPPLAVLGIAISFFEWSIIIGALGLFFLNFLGIVFAAVLVFSVLKFYEVKEVIEKKIKAEEKILEEERREKEKEKIEEIEKKVKEMSEIIKEKKKEVK